jgi:N-acetylglucosaminyl-diphospho-decaprenol L-rhamnosyltransferase
VTDLDIAIVIVTYKSSDLAIESLRSIQSERSTAGLRIRVIVVDNASGDLPKIEEAVRTNGWSSWITLVLAPRNGGFAYGNNLGIARAYADGRPSYFYLLNPDTQVRPGAIGSLVEFLELRQDVGIAGSSFETLDGQDWSIAFRFPTLLSELTNGLQIGFLERILRRWTVAREMTAVAQPTDWISGASMLIRPTVLLAIGGLDENYFLYFEETEFCYRARLAGFTTWYVPKSRVMHIIGQSTSVSDSTLTLKRLPNYWFESRRRFFAMAYGVRHALLIDIVSITASSLGLLKRVLLRRARTPHYIRDFLRHSILLPRNRDLPAIRCFFPPK